MRFGDLSSSSKQNVVVLDGGFAGAVPDFINFLDEYYDTTSIDLVISTHPDGDHTAGLITLVEELSVGELWMHRPWRYESEVYSYVLRGSTSRVFSESMKRALSTAWELEKAAQRAGVPITEPFEGLTWGEGALRVLGPTREYYSELVENFGMSAVEKLAAKLKSAVTAAKERIVDLWDEESLVEPESTAVTNRNNSSVILQGTLDEASFLFTGDAGVPALERALDIRDGMGFASAEYTQLPHHGAKRNVGPTITDRLIGPRVPEGTLTGKRAFISAAERGAPTHPSQRVINAACRRGCRVYVTAGKSMVFKSGDRPGRPSWSSLSPYPFIQEFDEE